MKIKEVRYEIKEFAMEMERIMRKHDKKKGDSWKGMNVEDLRFLASKEVDEWLGAISDESVENERHELVDIANILMMIRYRLGEDA